MKPIIASDPLIKGSWLKTIDGETLTNLEIVGFDKDEILHFKILNETKNGELKTKVVATEKISDHENYFINEHRIRLVRPGTNYIIDEGGTTEEETSFEIDYVRIHPTKTELTEEEIRKLEFTLKTDSWTMPFSFIKSLDNKTTQEINKVAGREGRNLVLEKLGKTYFGTIYNHGVRSKLIPIKEISTEVIVVYGFAVAPYEVTGKRVDTNDD